MAHKLTGGKTGCNKEENKNCMEGSDPNVRLRLTGPRFLFNTLHLYKTKSPQVEHVNWLYSFNISMYYLYIVKCKYYANTFMRYECTVPENKQERLLHIMWFLMVKPLDIHVKNNNHK